jgi:hypothetical protein
MVHSLDIFKTDPDGSVLWRCTEEDFAAAKKRIDKLALSSPGVYVIFDQDTGNYECKNLLGFGDGLMGCPRGQSVSV